MTVNIKQHVTPRSQHLAPSTHRFTSRRWNARHRLSSQRGSVTQQTITVSFGVICILAVVMLGFVYLRQIFVTASSGSDIQALEMKMLDLKETQKELELEGAKLRSIQSVEEKIKNLSLISTEEVAYLAPQQDKVALRSFN